jgi:hypothetical protein
MFGYFFVFCRATSSSDSGGPWDHRVFFGRIRAACDGGLNLSGFSSTRGRKWESFGAVEA